jgi:hypothetical protein
MSLALLIASLVATALGSIKGVPSEIGTITGSISSVLGVLFKNGVGTPAQASTTTLVIASLQALIAQLKNTPGLSADALTDITLLSDALAAAVTQNATITTVVPTNLQPITPIT